MLPTTDPFRKALDALGLSRKETQNSVLALRGQVVVDERGRKQHLPGLWLTWKDGLPVSFEALCRRLRAELESLGHPATEPAVFGVLAMLVGLEPDGARLQRVNDWLTRVYPAGLTQLVVLPGRPRTGFALQLGEFHLGALDLDRFLRWSAEDGASFFPQYTGQLRGMLAIERDPVSAPFFEAMVFAEEARLETAAEVDLGGLLLDNYFQVTAEAHFAAFWDRLQEVQLPLLATAGPHLDVEILHQIEGRRMISCIRKVGPGGRGWVVPMVVSATFFDPRRLDLEVNREVDRLRSRFGFDPWAAPLSPFDHALHTFLEFVAIGRKHQLQHRPREAFLHFVIALDLFFGASERVGATVAARVALVTHRAQGRSLPEQVATAKAVYGARSKYVHEGRSPEAAVVAAADALVAEVLEVALRARQHNDATFSAERWLKTIDYVTSALDAGRPVDDGDWRALGVAPGGSDPTAPPADRNHP